MCGMRGRWWIVLIIVGILFLCIPSWVLLPVIGAALVIAGVICLCRERGR